MGRRSSARVAVSAVCCGPAPGVRCNWTRSLRGVHGYMCVSLRYVSISPIMGQVTPYIAVEGDIHGRRHPAAPSSVVGPAFPPGAAVSCCRCVGAQRSGHEQPRVSAHNDRAGRDRADGADRLNRASRCDWTSWSHWLNRRPGRIGVKRIDWRCRPAWSDGRNWHSAAVPRRDARAHHRPADWRLVFQRCVRLWCW